MSVNAQSCIYVVSDANSSPIHCQPEVLFQFRKQQLSGFNSLEMLFLGKEVEELEVQVQSVMFWLNLWHYTKAKCAFGRI